MKLADQVSAPASSFLFRPRLKVTQDYGGGALQQGELHPLHRAAAQALTVVLVRPVEHFPHIQRAASVSGMFG